MAEYTIIVNDRTKLTMQESLETEKVSREEIMKALQK